LIKNKKIFISGGAGFIGSYLCERLIEHNRITVYDNYHRNALKFTNLLKNPHLNFIKGDVLDRYRLEESMQGSDIVLHLAAIAGIDTVVKKPIVTMKVNLLGTHHTLEAAVKNKIKKFINFSTSEVYGPYVYKGGENDLTTQGEVGKLRWTYSASKLAAEHMAHCYYKEYGMGVISVRPFNVYGPRQVGEGAIIKFIQACSNKKNIFIYGDGTQIRAWCYIDDFVDGIMLLLEKNGLSGQSFNIGNPQGTITTLRLAERIIELSGSKSKVFFKKSNMPDVEVRVPSIIKAQKFLGFNPKVGLDEGIKKTIEWYRNNNNVT